jgi:steroid Delta-isomerase
MDAVQRGDREGWLDNFTPDAVVEDPVGTSPLDPTGEGHHGRDAIGRFWDTTIATMEGIAFEIHDSFACGDEVVNVGSIHLTFAGGARGRTDGVFHYVVDGTGRVRSLRAFWELDRTMATIQQPDDAP